jgi:HPt (histidine-containing phosphotransfer) domain-containing protein
MDPALDARLRPRCPPRGCVPQGPARHPPEARTGDARQALAAELRQLAHRIKGLAGSLGFPELTALAAPVEMAVLAGDVDRVLQHSAGLLQALQRLRPEPETRT